MSTAHAYVAIFTARIRRIGEGNIFSLCVSSHLHEGGGGYNHPVDGGGEGTTIQLMGGTTIQLMGATPFSGPGRGVPTSQVQPGGYPFPGPAGGGGQYQVRSQDGGWGGYPSGQIPGWGVGWVPPYQGQILECGGNTPCWNSIVCTCYTAGGMPLAFTQEDFLVRNYI